MARTRKWSFVQQEAERLTALGLTVREIAKRLDVNPSSITRWRQAGKLTRAAAPRRGVRTTAPKQTPAEWAASVRADYKLDSTDDQLVMIGEEALAISSDRLVSPQARMSAAGRFQAVVKQLALVQRRDQAEQPAAPEQPAEAPPPPRRAPVARPPGDPRGILAMAVSK